MLQQLNWGQYWGFVCLILALYYSYTFYQYRHVWLGPRTRPVLPAAGDDDLFPQVDACGRELDAYLEQAGYGKPSKNELVFGVHQILKKFPGLATTKYKDALNQVIQFSARDKCTIHLTEEDLRQVWMV